MGTSAAQKAKSIGWKAILKSIKRPPVAIMVALGFSSGLPFMLVGNTLSFWLRESGITLATIGFMSWVGLAYSFKFVWAPLIDKFYFPVLGSRLGARRGWMVASQILIMLGLVAMAITKPEGGLLMFTSLAVLVAFASATQDIVVDAWRIESSENPDDMALFSAAYHMGYRIALLITDAWIFIIVSGIGWSTAYIGMGLAMVVGVLATWWAAEPQKTLKPQSNLKSPTASMGKIIDGIFGPLVAFFQHHGSKALLMLAAVSLYRLADFVMGPMANPFYVDLGIGTEVVGAMRTSVGLVGTVVGVAAAGFCSMRWGLVKTLLLGAILGPLSNLAFTILAFVGARTDVFAAAMFIDNFSNGFAGVALVGYMSSLTSVGYTATQYALLSSFYTLFGKFLKGFSGVIVDQLAASYGPMNGYALFFAGTTLIGVPALVLCWLLSRNQLKSAT